MKDLWEVVAELAVELHPERVSSLASQISTISTCADFSKIRGKISPNVDTRLLNLLESKWTKHSSVMPSEIAAALVTSALTSEIASSRGSVEMVWTGPTTGLVPIRHTEQVLREVIEYATTKLIIVSFVAHDVPGVLSALNRAVARNVSVDILVESSQNSHSKIRVDSVPKMKTAVPGANLYIWDQTAVANTAAVGVVHAKCAVADGEIAFITSANLTTAAMEKNVELGVLIKGGSITSSLDAHLTSLIVSKTLKQV